jgi:hypothetical protein
MSVVNTYKVHYHFEQGGKKSGPEYYDFCQASAGDYSSLKTVLSNNARLKPGTLVIDSVEEIAHADSAIA